MGFSWRLSLGERLDLLIDGGPFYVGASRLTFGGRQHYRMGDYATGRLAFGVRTAGWTATVFVDTLFDTEANTLAYSDPFRLSDTQSITSLQPRTIGLTLRWAPWLVLPDREVCYSTSDRQTSESPTAFGGGAFWCFGCGSRI